MDYTTIKLENGTIRTYERGDTTLYAYETKDPIDDQVILVRRNNTLVSVEAPLFKKNVTELNEFVSSLGVKETYVLVVDHVCPQDYLKGAKLITTAYALDTLRNGQPKGLFTNFVNTFGEDNISKELNEDYALVDNTINIDGIEFELIPNGGEFDVVIKNMNSIYTHMLGHDVHSIIGGQLGGKAMIDRLNEYVSKAYSLILTSHYVPETIDDVKTKISYVEDVLNIASSSKNREEFVSNVRSKYPHYTGLNYLDITASIFFKE